MRKRRIGRHSKPKNAFRYISNGNSSHYNDTSVLSPSDYDVINHLKSGAKIVLSIIHSEALLLSFSSGFKLIKKLTIRTLSRLLSVKAITMVTEMNGHVHFAWSGANTSWYSEESSAAKLSMI